MLDAVSYGASAVGSDRVLEFYRELLAGRKDAATGGEDPAAGDTVSLTGPYEPEPGGVYTKRQLVAGGEILFDDGGSEGSTLSGGEEEQVRLLQARDREVRRHEQTHAAMLGPYARGGPTYAYQIGPDGKAYAVGGSVTADLGPEATPAATARKAQILRMAATGAGSASAADIAVAGSALAMELKSRHSVAA